MLTRVDQSLPIETTCALRIHGLCKSFGATRVLQGIDLDAAAGELIAVLGPSGSGKTTLLRLLCGFERADAGRIELGGRVVTGAGIHLPPEQRGIGYVAQEGALFPHLSVAENILFGLRHGARAAGRRHGAPRAAELLELVGLPASYASRRPSTLSGGEQQRVALARALAPNPAIVLLDEPFSALDAALRSSLRDAVATSLARVHTTALLVTHDQDEALSMGHRVAVLHHGRFAQVADPQALYRFPASRDIARFVGEAVIVRGTAADGVAECCFGRLPLAANAYGDATPLNGAVEVMIRPEQFLLGAVPGSAAARAETRASVEQLTFYGHDARLVLRLPCGQAFTAATPSTELPTLGEEVTFRIAGSVVAYPLPAA